MFLDSALATLTNLGLPPELIVVAIAALPVVELRGAIPVALNIFHFPWQYALVLAILGNLLPAPVLLFCFGAICRRLSRVAIFKRWLDRLEDLARRRGEKLEKRKWVGLMTFVAVPLPATGAWTGSIVASVLNMRLKTAFLSVLAGLVIAGGIVTAIVLLAKRVL
jgi:uncharacterized membrane protein